MKLEILQVIANVEHDLLVVRQYREARLNGGQHVGSGGPLGAASPSMLAYLDRLCRDLREVLTPSAPDEPQKSG